MSVSQPAGLVVLLPLRVEGAPPCVRWVCVNRRGLIPRLGGKKIVDVLDAIVPPDSVMHTLPALRLESIVDVRKRGPAVLEHLGKQRLIGKDPIGGVRCSQAVGDDFPCTLRRSGHNDSGVAQTPAALDWGSSSLGELRGVMLKSPAAIGGDPFFLELSVRMGFRQGCCHR